MKKKGKAAIIAGAAAVVLLGATALLLLFLPQPDTGDDLLLRAGGTAEVLRVSITGKDGQSGDILVLASEGGFEIEGIPSALVDYQRFVELMNACATVRAQRLVEEKPDDVSVYGLEAPSAEVQIEYTGGAAVTLVLGDAEPVSGGRYFMAGGRSAVYLMEGTAAAGFVAPPYYFVERRATPPLKLASPLSAVQNAVFTADNLPYGKIELAAVSGGSDEVKRRAISYGAPTHLVVSGNDTFEMDQTYGIEVLGSLLGVEAEEIVAINQTPGQIADFGFDSPAVTVAFDLINSADATPQHYVLKVADSGGDTLLTVNDYGAVYKISPSTPFLQLDAQKLMMRWYISPLLMDVAEIEVSGPVNEQGENDGTFSFTVSGEGNALKAQLDGEEVDIERFRKLYQLLISAYHDGAPVQDAGWNVNRAQLVVTYRYKDTAKAPDVVRFYSAGTRRAAVSVNENPVVFGMRESYINRVLEGCAALRRGEEFAVEW